MSIAATNWVWSLNEDSPAPLPNATYKLVLMKHADHAHDDGTHAFQGIKAIAKYALCSERTAQRANAWLVEHGYLREGDQSVIPASYEQKPIAYELAMSEVTRREWEALAAAGVNSRRDAAAAAGSKGGRTSAQVRRGDNLSPLPATSNAQVGGGDNLSPLEIVPEDLPGGDNQGTQGVTNPAPGGDTRVTQTTLETFPKNQTLLLSQAADAASDEDEVVDATDSDANLHRDDVTRVCEHLLARIKENGYRPLPTITQEWRRSARLLMDADGRSERQVHNMIEWATKDDFWRANIRSMLKLRKHYDAMKERASQGQGARPTRRGYDDEATWGKYDASQPVETMSDEEAAAIFGTLEPQG